MQSIESELRQSLEAELMRNISLTLKCDPKSPFTKHVLEFIAIILRSFSSTNQSSLQDRNNRSDEENCPPIDGQQMDNSSADELGLESFGSQSFQSFSTSDETRRQSTDSLKVGPNLTDIVIKELLIKYLYSVNTECRYNTCVLIRKLFTDLEDIDTDVYNRLRKVCLFSHLLSIHISKFYSLYLRHC